jgi:N-acetylglucosaminyldiphosphoundecaprenol N-acetyl-beta-D-mannosaminyltransferase
MSTIIFKDIKLLSSQKELRNLPSRKSLINTINAHSYNTARKDKAFAEALTQGDVLIPDGAGIVLAVRLLRNEQIERIAGWDLFQFEMRELESRHKQAGSRGKVFFLGSSESVLKKIKERATTEFPHLDIYTYSPPYKPEFSDEDNRQMINAVNQIQPDLLWIGMTAPKQEKWAYTHLGALDVSGHIGTVGAVFDFYAGTIKRAPIWWQENGLEWLYRLIKEPRRMWKRYIIGNTKFLYYILMEKWGR